jgi:hypothetical protein
MDPAEKIMIAGTFAVLDAHCASMAQLIDSLAGLAPEISGTDREDLAHCMATCSRSTAGLLATLRRVERQFSD